jgi:hypothetical protein
MQKHFKSHPTISKLIPPHPRLISTFLSSYLNILHAEMREGSTATIKTKFSAIDEFEEFMQKITMA